MSDLKHEHELLGYEDAYSNVMALYCTLNGADLSALGRDSKPGEIAAEILYFRADVEIKAKRVLTTDQYRRLMSLAAQDRYNEVPPKYKQALGVLFLRSDMNYDGAYRSLYFKAKNDRLIDRDEPQHFVEEEA